MKKESAVIMEEYLPLQVKENHFSTNEGDYCEVLPPYTTRTK